MSLCIKRLCIAASMLAFVGQAWFVTKGPCTSDSFGCVMSPNFPGNYSNGQSCQMTGSPGCSIFVEHFSTESSADFLCVQAGRANGSSHETCYSGSALPDNIVPGTLFTWRSDSKGTDSGWKLCPRGPGCLVSKADKDDHAKANRSTDISHVLRNLQFSIAAMAAVIRIYGLLLCVGVAVLAVAAILSWLPRSMPPTVSIKVPLLDESQHGPAIRRKEAVLQTDHTCAACAEEGMVLGSRANQLQQQLLLQQQQSLPPHLEARLASLERELSLNPRLASPLLHSLERARQPEPASPLGDSSMGRQLCPPGLLFDLTRDDSISSAYEGGTLSGQLIPPGKLFDLTHDDSTAASFSETGSLNHWLA